MTRVARAGAGFPHMILISLHIKKSGRGKFAAPAKIFVYLISLNISPKGFLVFSRTG